MNSRRVLIVDDEPRNLSLLEAVLAPLGVDIVLASDGERAVELFKHELSRGGFDLVFLDIMMPVMDGWATLAAMRAHTPAGQRVPIVLVTALGARDARIRGLEAGADEFITKPVDAQEVRCRARTLLAQRAAHRTLADRAALLDQCVELRAEPGLVAVRTLFSELARRHQSDIDAMGARLLVNADPSLGSMLDERLIARAVENLLENAARYCSPGGCIELAARNASGALEITVSNTGASIDEASRANLFETRAGGLGLLLCRLVAEAHGGTIRYESDAVWPTRFVMKLPTPTLLIPNRRSRAFADDTYA